MIDFTKKGTKLPIIPIGTEFITPAYPTNKHDRFITQSHFASNLFSYGMYDEIYLRCEKPNYEASGGNNHFLIKLSTIERLAKEQGMCDDKPKYIILNYANSYNGNSKAKIINMKAQITLNDNGEVTVTENNTTTIHSKETALQIYEVVKTDLEKPKFKPNLGDWCHYMGGLYVWNEGKITYGFNAQGRYGDKYLFSVYQEATPAPAETVKTAFKEYTTNLGFVNGVKINPINKIISAFGVMDLGFKTTFKAEENEFWMGGYCLFKNGIFATIIQPETISIQEAEKRLDCKIDKNL